MLNTPLTPPAPTLDSGELWKRFRAGDEDALGKLARVHFRSLYNYGLRVTTSEEQVKDAIQDLFLELWDRRAFVSDAVFVKTYLLTALRYKLQKARQRVPQRSTDGLDSSEIPFDVSIEQQLIDDETQTEQVRQLHRLMTTLSKRQQEILYLRFYQNLDNQAIAEVMGVEKQSVANLLHRTLTQLREHWPPGVLLALLHLLF